MNFSQALPIVAIISFLIFLILYGLGKGKTGFQYTVRSFWILNLGFIPLAFYFLIDAFRRTVRQESYFVFITVFASCLLIELVFAPDNKRSRTIILVCSLCMHIISTGSNLAIYGIAINERSYDLQRIISMERWTFEGAQINAFYSFFPLDLGILTMISKITGVYFTSTLIYFMWCVGTMLVFDLLIYTLIQRLEFGWKAGILAILLASASPNLVWFFDHAHYSLAFILIILFLVFGETKVLNQFIIGIIVGLAGIILHVALPSTIIFLLLILTLTILFRFFHQKIQCYPRGLLSILGIISLIRWIFIESGFDRMLKTIPTFFESILFGEISKPGLGSQIKYDQFVSPLFAYTWAIPIGIVAAYVFVELTRMLVPKSRWLEYPLVLLGSTGLLMGIVTFIMQVIAGMDVFTPRLSPAAYTLIIIAMANACKSLLRSKGLIVFSMLALLVPYFVIGFQDPNKASDRFTNFALSPNKEDFEWVSKLKTFMYGFGEGGRIIVTTRPLSRAFMTSFITGKNFRVYSPGKLIASDLVNYAQTGLDIFEYEYDSRTRRINMRDLMFVRPSSDVSGSIIDKYNIAYNSGLNAIYWTGYI